MTGSAGIPPVCGGYRSLLRRAKLLSQYSPRVRGLSVTFWQLVKHFCVFPPCAGVIGDFCAASGLRFGIPPACGGYRFEHGHVELFSVYSPACGGYRLRIVIGIRFRRYSPRTRGYRHKNRNGGAFVMCPYKQMELFTIKESYFLLDNPHSAISCRLQSEKALRR